MWIKAAGVGRADRCCIFIFNYALVPASRRQTATRDRIVVVIIVVAVCVALDQERVWIGEFDLDVALVDTWEFPVGVVATIQLAHFKCWCEGATCLGLGTVARLVAELSTGRCLNPLNSNRYAASVTQRVAFSTLLLENTNPHQLLFTNVLLRRRKSSRDPFGCSKIPSGSIVSEQTILAATYLHKLEDK